MQEKTTSYDDESEESRYIPDIDEYSKDTEDLESEIPLVLLEEVKTTPELATDPTDDTMLSAEKIETLATFSNLCRAEGIEVLKLNRRNKWQPRFLTVSSEVISLQHTDDLMEFPKALLWVKRFSAKSSYSLATISNEGRGGVEFSKIESVSIENSENMPPKSYPKFKQSVQLNLHYTCGDKARNLAFRFKKQADADIFADSIDAVTDLLDHEGIF